jgi:hypothetical protein
MIYTSGVVLDLNVEESLEQLQDNKLAIVCNKLNLKPTDKYASCRFLENVLFIMTLDSSILAVDGELLWPMLRRTLDATRLVLPLPRTRRSSVLTGSRRMA